MQIHFAGFFFFFFCRGVNLLEAMEKLWVNGMGGFGEKMTFELFLGYNYSCHPISLDQWMTRIYFMSSCL